MTSFATVSGVAVRFNYLARAARKYILSSSSSIENERMFSAGGNVCRTYLHRNMYRNLAASEQAATRPFVLFLLQRLFKCSKQLIFSGFTSIFNLRYHSLSLKPCFHYLLISNLCKLIPCMMLSKRIVFRRIYLFCYDFL